MNLSLLMVLFVCSASVAFDERRKSLESDVLGNVSIAKKMQQTSWKWEKTPHSCSSRIYCYGNLLHTMQMSGMFNDSKSFVDMAMKHDQDEILVDFDKFMMANNQTPTIDKLKTFMNDNFEVAKELEDWLPPDFQDEPPILMNISQEDIRTFAKNVASIWKGLGRKISSDTLKNIRRHSLIPLYEGFIVPGGRFRETYYWDTYWIIKGLLICNMHETVRGMLNNFVTLIKVYGFIPNGARLYYTQRSQPPLFALMVYEYFNVTKDIKWLRKNIQYVAKEVEFWLTKRKVFVEIEKRGYFLAQYYPVSLGPRPESYKEDYNTASLLPSQKDKDELYANLKGGAESGWDFSSRWFFDEKGGNNVNLSRIDMKRIIPADLNSFLYKACQCLSLMYGKLSMPVDAAKWSLQSEMLRNGIRAVLFNEEDQMWYDFDTQLKRHRRHFSVSNLAPLWVNAQDFSFNSTKLIKKLIDSGVFDYKGGTPATLKQSGEQWDFPNAWPPLQAIIVQGLANIGTKEAEVLAETLAKNWIRANMIGYAQTETMFEKYDAVEPGKYGGGGEYEVQSGFGWTNGVVLEFIKKYFT